MIPEKFEYQEVYDTGELKVCQLGNETECWGQKVEIPEHYLVRKRAKERFFAYTKKCECGEVGSPHMVYDEQTDKGRRVKYLDYKVEMILCRKCLEKYKPLDQS